VLASTDLPQQAWVCQGMQGESTEGRGPIQPKPGSLHLSSRLFLHATVERYVLCPVSLYGTPVSTFCLVRTITAETTTGPRMSVSSLFSLSSPPLSLRDPRDLYHQVISCLTTRLSQVTRETVKTRSVALAASRVVQNEMTAAQLAPHLQDGVAAGWRSSR